MNILNSKSFFSISLSLMLFCVPVSAQEPVKKKNIILQVGKRILLCGVDAGGIVVASALVHYAVQEDGLNAKKCFSISALFLFVQSFRGLFYDVKKIWHLGKRHTKQIRARKKAKNIKKLKLKFSRLSGITT